MTELEKHAAWLREFLDAKWPLEQGWEELMRHCRGIAPEAPWELVQEVDLKREVSSFQSWLRESTPGPEESKGIAAYYFGVSEDGASVHLDGTSEFDPLDATCDWACDFVYRNEEDWDGSRGLAVIGALSQTADGDVPVLLYLLGLGYVGMLVTNYGRGLGRPLAVGFDDGDAYVLPRN